VEIGDADQILHHPQHPYTKSLLEAIPRLARAEVPGKEGERNAF